MAEDKKVEGRTAFLEKNMKDGMLKKALVGASKVGDAVGFTQEKEYAGKTAADLAKKSGAQGTTTSKGYKAGGKVMNESKMMKKEGRGMAKASMQKVATKAVKKHEKAMHGMAGGGKACGGKMKYGSGGKIDGCAVKGKTKGRMV